MSEALDRLARLPPEKRLLLQKMLREKAAREDGSRAGIRRREAAGPVPLSFAQRRLWFLDRMEPGSPAYDVPTFMRLRGALDASALVRALGEIVRRHESLRTVFPERGGEPVQVVLPPGGFPVPRVDLRGLAGEVRVREVARLALAEGLRPFDLERGPVARATLLLLAADDSVLLVNTHHIVTDEWSVGVMMREVSALYGAFARGEPSPLPEPEIQFADYALWQHELLSGKLVEEQLAFWREKLRGAPPVLELPVDRPRGQVPGPETLNVPFGLPPEVAAAVRALARAEGATLFMTLLAGFQALLARWSGTDDVSVGTPIAGRTRGETEGLIGYLANTLVVRADLSDDPSGRALLARVREAVLGAHAHQDVPFERLVEELAPERSLSHSPLFQVMFALESYPEQEASLGPLEVDIMGVGGGAAKFDLTAIMTDLLDTIDGRLSGRAELFDEGSLARLRDRYAALMAGMAADPDRPVSAIPLLDAAERARLLDGWSAAGAADPAPRCLHELFAEQAARRPGATALVHGAATVTYAELDRRSDALAHRLAALGVGPDVRVGICMERSPALVVGLLGILKAGGAYVPLDPQFPDERLAFVLADAGAPALVTEARLAERFAGFGGELVLEDVDDVPHSRTFVLPHSPSPENLACVVYTSGSTGQPKGAGVPHRAVPGFFRGVDYARFDEDQVLLQHSAVSWDALTLELWPALLTGGICVLYPGGTPEPEELARQVREHGVTTLWLTSAFFNLVVDTCPEVLRDVRQVMTGGEAVSAAHVRRALELSPGLRLVNGYGPSECTVFSSAWVVPAGFRGDTVPIGRPVGDRRVYLLDRRLEPVPVGVPGELYVGGPAVARGYLGRPEPTAAAFVPDPFVGEPGARLYRTGDRARWRPDGVLEFAGRVDQQVKVRGFRVEPGEVETALARHPAVREAVVVAREAGAGGRRLVAYVTAEADAEVSPPELRAYLGGRLPAHMVPDAVVVLDAMPLTAHGKTDRRALPAPGAPDGAGAYVPPRTPAEGALAAVWAEVLGVDRVGAADDFFALGGQSLLAMRVVARLREALGVELPLRAVFEAPTLAGLAERIGGPGATPLAPIPRRAGEGPPPLSFAQQRLWLIDRMEPGSAAYNMPAGLRLRGRLDVAVLERTLGEVVRRHESLRTVFGVADGHPVQTVLPAAPARIPVVELAGLPGEARERALRRLAAGEAGRPFDLARGPLLRTVAVRLGPREHAVLFTMHHVVGDGWSMGVLVRELSALYEAFARGEPSPLPALPVQYPDYAVWQRGWLTGEVLDAQLAFWRERLAGAPPVLELPTDRPRPPTPGTRGAAVPFALGAEAARGLRALARSEGATLFAALLAGVQALLGRWAGSDDVVVGTPTAGRTRAELEGLIGFFVNTLALRTDLSGDPTPRVLVRRARETVLGAQAHQDVPFERLVEELAPERSLRHTPLFQALFALQNNREETLSLGSLELEPLPAESGSIRFDLELSLAEQGDEVRGVVAFRTALFDASTLERLASHLAALLAGMAADPDRRLSDVDLMDAAERERVLVARNDTAREYPPLPAHLLFAAQAARTPAAVAVLSAAGALTYAELDARAEALAARLRGLGVGPEVPVGLCVERTPEQVAGVLGIWKAGGAYVPLDPAYPAERLALVARDAALRVVVASRDTAELVPDFGGEVVLCDAQGEHGGVDGAGAVAGCPLSLAYVIYTSGSTGAPKGVQVQHGSLSNLLHAAREAFGVGAGDVVPVLSSSAFDIWLFETLLPLSVGAAVRLVERERVLDAAGLVAEAADATALHAVPALMRQVVREAAGAGEPRLGALRRLFVGGEAVPPELLGEMRAAFPSAGAYVTYGPTEAAVLACAYRVPAAGAVEGHRIGAPLANVRVYVCDAAGSAQPEGVPGELWIAGAGVARGYGGRPELTAEKFVPDAFGGVPGARAYRSGDRVRWRAEGVLEFLGRTDAQVKVRGFRIEPGEVEAALAGHPCVREAAVAVREEGGERRLVGYVVAVEGAEVDGGEVRAWLKGRLPEYMVPSVVVALEELPRTPTGKVDRRALPAPESWAGAAYVAPRGEVEERLAAIWAEVLKTERVGAHDDFFALGGHSLLATRVTSRIAEETGTELPLRDLFEAPTVAGLAARLTALLPQPATPTDDDTRTAAAMTDETQAAAPATGADPADSPDKRLQMRRMLAERAGRRRQQEEIRPVARDPRSALPLSFAQRRLWFIDRMEPGHPAYNMPFPLRLRGTVAVPALRRALAEIVRRHEVLRTVFAVEDGEPVQVIRPAGPVAVPVLDLGGLHGDVRDAELKRLADADAVRPFRLERGPLLRATLVRLADAEWGMLLAVHHIAADGWSTTALVRELSALYDAFRRGRPSPLPEPRVQYADFAAWQREWLAGPRLEEQLAFWRETLAGAPPTLDLPLDRPRPAVPGIRGDRHLFVFPLETSGALRRLALGEGVTPFMLLLAGFSLLLARYAGTDDVSVGTGAAGRTRVELEGLIGFFVNTLVLRTRLSGDPTGRELLRRVRDTTLGAFAHQDVPFERLVEELAPGRSLRHTPLFQVMFNFQNLEESSLDMGGGDVEPLRWSGEVSKFDLSLTAREDHGHLGGFVTFRTDLFEPATVERLVEHFRVLLEGLAADPGRPVSALPLMDAAERARVLEAAHGPTRAYPRHLSVHALFERQAARTPDAVAAVFAGGSLTYAELDRRAAILAHDFLRRRLAPETRIGVFLERGPEWLAVMLAVLKAGAVYVPLDPSHPTERVRWVLEDSGASLLLTSGGLRGRVPEFGGEIVVVAPSPPGPLSPASGRKGGNGNDVSLAPLPLAGEGLGRGPVAPDSLAYVIYTSGSTGTPKGVLTTHGGAANYLAFLADEYGLGEDDTVLQMATPTFDASIRETLGPLTVGARLVLTSAGETADPRRVLERVREHGVTAIMAVVPSVLRPILAEAEQSADAAGSLRLLLASGEPLPVADVRRAHVVFGAGLRVVNQWGATECTMSSTLHTVADDEAWPIAPVGVPIHNTRVFVLDSELEPTPLGVAGEAYIATPGLARGYGGRPDLTAEKFVPDPFSVEPGARMYRVGDRVRRRRDGVLEFLGRVDQQVKVQGVRVEPGEIEAVLRAHPGVGAAAVVARGSRPGEARLVAYIVASDGPDAIEPTAAELRAYLADRLPSYMVPAGWVSLDALPLLPNGKLDRRALPDPDESAAEAEYVAPRTPTEEILAGIWAEVLSVERVGAADDFFALGGHSLLATRMTARVRESFGADLPLRTLFEAPTLGGTAERLEALLREGGGGVPPLVPTPRDGRPLPLSFAQQRLWFIHQFSPESAAYNMPHPLRLRGALDVGALGRSLAALVARHEALRTDFAVVDGEPVQVVHDDASVTLPIADLSGLPADARDAETRRLIGEETLRPFDLARGPLMRALLLRAGAEEHAVLFTLHHIVADGWSLGVLVREVSALYGAFSRGEAPRLAPLPIQYGDYAAWQRAWLSGEALERQVGWWRERLAGAPPLLEIPTDRPRPAVMSEAGASRPFALSAEASRALAELSRREGATLFMTLLAGWQALLSRWSGQADVVVGTPLAGRTRLETEGLIGMFVNTLALRAVLRDGADFRELLGQVREMTLGAYAHQEVPFEKLVEELRVERSLRWSPIFQAVVALQNAERGELEMGAVEVEPLSREEETAKFDLHLNVAERGGRLHGVLSYRAALWEPATIGRMTEHLRVLLEGIAAAPERPVAELPLMPAEERAQVLEGWSAAGRDYPAGEVVCDLLEAQSRRSPAAPALSFRGETITYGELDRWSNRLANHLRGLGVGPETRVGVCLARTPELVVALVAVLKAGGAYVPLDPAYPRERLGYMQEDAGVSLVLSTTLLAGVLPAGTPVLALDAARAAVEAESDAAPRSGVLPENLSHVIFTSGSTGRPKGVMIRQSSTVVLLRWLREIVTDEERGAVLFSTSINFDVSVAEVFGTLAWGGKLVMVESALELATVEEPVVHASMVPTAAAELLRMRGIPPGLRTLNLGGEPLPGVLAQALYALGTVEKVGNLYGPTEDTTYSTYSIVERGGSQVFVGRPVANTRAMVLDARLEPTSPGVVGELYLAGGGLARGYAARPDLTAERFLPDPFGEPGSRMYRVMDRVRRTPGGELEYFGRTDFQVKVRGYRIELGDVEAALLSHPGVAEAVAAVREDAPGERRIVAYLVASADRPAPGAGELRTHLREHLPEYMVPAAFVALDRLPLTPNGKLDRRALPAPGGPAAEREYVAPRTAAEELLARVFGEVLGLERVGVHDHFFDLGGHSLLATRVVSRVREVFGVELPLRTVFEHPTVAELAPQMEALQPAAAVDEWEVDEELARLAELSDEEVMRLLKDI